MEIKRISPDISALIDSERSVANASLAVNREGFVKACGEAQIACRVLECRATENYFPDRAVKQALGNEYTGLKPFQRLNEATRPWGKSDNWRIAREMTRDDLKGTDLGSFLDKLCAAPTIGEAEEAPES
jgi:hypothetical protein